MADQVPNLDREKLLAELFVEAERTVNEVADAVDNAPAGRIIRDSEEPARDALDRFRQVVYERALQAKVDAAEAAFPPLRRAWRRASRNAIKAGRTTACCRSTAGCSCAVCVGIAHKPEVKRPSIESSTKRRRSSAKAYARWPAA